MKVYRSMLYRNLKVRYSNLTRVWSSGTSTFVTNLVDNEVKQALQTEIGAIQSKSIMQVAATISCDIMETEFKVQ